MRSTKEKKEESYFLSQPHQPFFMLGILSAIVMMLLFALSQKHILTLEIERIHFHTYSLIFILFKNVFTGFLFTTFPRFCQGEVVVKSYYKRLFFAESFGVGLFIFGVFTSLYVTIFAMVILFVSHLFVVLKLQNIFKNALSKESEDPFWILFAQKFGLFGHLLFILGVAGLGVDTFAITISFYLYLVFLTFVVGQRMIPFFSHSTEAKDERFVTTVFILLLVKTILSIFDNFTSVKVAQIILDLLLGLYLLGEFTRWRLSILQSPPIIWVLQLGLFWFPTALFISALAQIAALFLDTNFYFLGVRLIAIGFITTILIGFGTRVILGHSGQPPVADRLAINIFYFVQVVVVLRALYSLNIAFNWGADFLFDISFSAWLLLFLVWGARYAKVLIFGSKI